MELILENGTWIRGEPLAGADPSGFGQVYSATNEAGEDAVAKFIKVAPGADRELLISDLLTAEGRPNIVPMLDYGRVDENWVVIMPRAEKSLARHLADNGGSLELEEAVAVLEDIATALASLDGDIVHRDLKPPNILRYNETWCLTDFGISRYAEATTAAETHKFKLTPPYAAPEQWTGERAVAATDMYAFGIIAFEVIDGRLPFEGPAAHDYREQHLLSPVPTIAGGTSRLRALIEECMLKAPQARPSASNALQRLGKVLGEPLSPGASKLAEANRAEQSRRHAEDLAKTASAAEAKRRKDLYEAAVSSFSSFWAPMRQAIVDDAPLATFESRSSMEFIAKLKSASIGMSTPELESPWSDGPFDVIASAVISVGHGAGAGLRQGRAHSLWYCDAYERGSYKWFETAFMASAFSPQPAVVPFSLQPSEASVAFSNVIGTTQMAWQLEQLDRDDPAEFIDRWIGWFADAATGQWRQPSTLPERPIERSWRDANRDR